MKISGAQAVVRALVEQETDFVFGLPGAHTLELIDALIDSPVRHVLTASELGAAFMADGYARATGRVGVCLAVPGPGLTNMITGLAEALLDSSPMVVVVTTATADGLAFHTHEIPQLAAVAPVVKGALRIGRVTEIQEVMSRAFQLAADQEPGPVVVEVRQAVLRRRTDFAPSRPALAAAPVLPDVRAQIEAVVKMINSARRCGLYVGKGAQGASEKVRWLAEYLSAPVATTISGKGVLAEDHALAVGFGFGPAGTKAAAAVFKGCDVVLALGVKFSEMSAGKWLKFPGALVHIDACSGNLNRNYRADLALCLDAGAAVEAMRAPSAGLKEKHHPEVVQEISRYKAAHLQRIRQASAPAGLHPSYFFHHLAQALDRDTIVVTDCGAHQLWAITDYCVRSPNGFVTPADYQAMGFGIPAAVGAALGCPEKCTVCVCGDGGFLMTGFEILTAVRNKVNLAVVVFNDGALGHIKTSQRIIFGRTATVELNNPDFEKMAAAFRVDYLAVRDDSQLKAGLEKIRQNRGVVLMDVRIDYQQWPDYMRGVAVAAWRRLPLAEKLRLVAARASRGLKYGS